MKSNIERLSTVECRVNVEIPWTDISGRLTDKMRSLRQSARLPGFRPGKVPPKVIERRFGKSVRQELASELVQETFPNAVAQHETVPLTQPILESSSLEPEQPFTYKARFEVPPVIEPKDFTGVEVRRRPAVVDESKVDAELTQHQEKLTELRPLPDDIDREETAEGDVWTVDLEGALGSQRISKKDVRVDIGVTTGEYIPGLAAALEGSKLSEAGSLKKLTFTPPEDMVRAELRGAQVEVDIGMREVRLKHVPELDDEFAKDTGEAESLEELKTKIRDRIREEDSDQAEREARKRLVEALLENNEFEPAPSMVSREVSAQVDQTKRQLAQQGLGLSAIGTTEGQLASRIRPQALFNVKAYLLLDAIGKSKELDVSDEEFEAELTKNAEESGQNLARMRATMEKNGQLMMLRAQMREEKILDFLMGEAKVTEAPDPEPEEGDETA